MNRFVIQKQHATRLHWDFRLELDEMIKSWAIPRKPVKIQGKKYLPIQVEDHDVSYIDFEGEIEKGHYGAGQVYICDNRTFDLIERSENILIFRFMARS